MSKRFLNSPSTTSTDTGKDPLLSKAEAAAILGVKERWITHSVAERRLPYVKVGRLVRFRRSDLDAYIASNVVEPR